MAACRSEVHHRVPRCLLGFFDRFVDGDLDGPAYRPPKNLAFCRSFSFFIAPAVDAVDVFTSFLLCYWSLRYGRGTELAPESGRH